MERNRMEEEFKSKLNQREITPSAHAWERLDAMLNEAEDKKVVPVRKLNWLYIAAGFAGIILVGTMFFRNGEKTTRGNEVVIEDVQQNTGNSGVKSVDSVKEVKPMEIVPMQDNTQVATIENPTTNDQRPTTKKQKMSQPMIKNQSSPQIAQVQDQRPATNDQRPTTNDQRPTTNDQRPTINHQSINNPVNVTADEQLTSVETKLQNPKTIKVDANSLLSQVDGELELTFREKVIKVANKKYQNVKVALANRNQE